MHRRIHGQRTRAFDLCAHRQKLAFHFGLINYRIGRLARIWPRRRRFTLVPVQRIGEGVLVGDLRKAEPLHAHGHAFDVHHLEHCRHATIFLADQVSRRVLEVKRTGRRATDAHLVFDGCGDHAIALAKRTVLVDEELRHEKQADTARARRRTRYARDHEVQNILGEIVVTRGDEDF
jgi:hypothetical protein